VKAYICIIAAALMAATTAPAFAAPRHPAGPAHKSKPKPARKGRAASSGQTWRWGRCSVEIPKGWGDYRGGKASPKDHQFNVTLGGASSFKSMTGTLKAMNGRLVHDAKDLSVTRVQLRRRGAQQYWAVTKSAPACRATVTYEGAEQEKAARKIADSLRRRG
jgi:hypothetical protein